MPIYEYVCEKCGSHIEVMQKVGDAPLKRCQKCRGKLEKIVSRTSFQLKGAGWYMTDYSKPSGSSDKSDSSNTDKSEKQSSSKSSESASGSGGSN